MMIGTSVLKELTHLLSQDALWNLKKNLSAFLAKIFSQQSSIKDAWQNLTCASIDDLNILTAFSVQCSALFQYFSDYIL